MDRAGEPILSADNVDNLKSLRAVSSKYILDVEAAEAAALLEAAEDDDEEDEEEHAL